MIMILSVSTCKQFVPSCSRLWPSPVFVLTFQNHGNFCVVMEAELVSKPFSVMQCMPQTWWRTHTVYIRVHQLMVLGLLSSTRDKPYGCSVLLAHLMSSWTSSFSAKLCHFLSYSSCWIWFKQLMYVPHQDSILVWWTVRKWFMNYISIAKISLLLDRPTFMYRFWAF
jgi:hypothetical protein